MNLKLEKEFSKADILHDIDALKRQIDNMRPLPEDVEGRVMQKLRLDWNYNSNAIEGNKLSYGETAAFLSEGITAKGKPLKDHLDIRGHNEAISFLLDIVKDSRPISEADIRALHTMILVEPYKVKAQTATGAPTTKTIRLGEYKTSPNHVETSTGELHYYATPEETPAKMQDLMNWYSEVSKNPSIHPVVAAALFHHKFVAIHPFDDGNGRLSRIMMNLILMQQGFPPVVVKMDDRHNYYSLLRRADVGDSSAFVEYIAERLRSSLQLFLKAATGGDIDEDEDIDKAIALFKKELNDSINLREKKSVQSVNDIIKKEVRPMIQKILDKSKEFDELFFKESKFIKYKFKNKKGSPTSYKEDIHNNMLGQVNPKIEQHDIDRLEFNCGFREFRKANKLFNIDVAMAVSFDTYRYSIHNFDSEKVVENYYHESISNQDIHKLIMSLILAIKNQIQEKLN